ncbi:hypothetical protein [Phenylobacterium aquaticum]|uniref:hypothetical protein n=1 Tax=Phenylobacterium aquaticum TaxID=1763816 RepID=UPI001F5D5606|nr:hypothetical protein [Phenylobacterium aquaticum]MCI3131930.1 hypothetical protein [Phenylobacterium aquaticum]
MSNPVEAFVLEDRAGVLAGPVRRPANASKTAVGSIHDDATAQRLGFRGGTVAGNIHFEQFPPLLEAALGADWARTGSLSLYFLTPTTDGEPVQAFAQLQPDGRAKVWMDDAQGQKVCEGTASVGPPDAWSALRERLLTLRPAEDLRILAGVRVGDSVDDVAARVDSAAGARRLAVITEDLARYHDPAEFGARVAPPATAIDALRAVEIPLFSKVQGFVGMFGAIELQMLGGPIFADHDYLASGRVLALSESPKTEIVWYESTLRDATDGRPVARMILMSRLLKASSPLWT